MSARCCLQAWGLLELQRGNVLAAVLLLERCVASDPRCSPVLKWKPVKVWPAIDITAHVTKPSTWRLC